jgi:vitamin B12 transporter
VFCVALLSYGAVGAAAPAAIENVVITATRNEQSVDTIGSSITVLQPEDVKALQKITVADVLITTPGITLSRNGGLGGTTSVKIRGAENEHTIVLLDGVKLNDPSSPGGGYNFANLLTSDNARIEILRGPQSTLWGSQAIGGVINIVTPEPGGPLSAQLSTEYGSNNTAFAKAQTEAGNDVVGWRVAAGYLSTDGISALDEQFGGREDDSYRNTGVNARGIVHITDTVAAEARGTWLKSRNEFDGFTDSEEFSNEEQLIGYTGVLMTSLNGRLRNRLGFGYTETDRDNFDPSLVVRKTFDANGTNKRWEYQGTVNFNSRSNLTVGLESERSELSTASPSIATPEPTPLARDVDLDSAYALLQVGPLEAVSMTIGTRYDDHQTFGSKMSNSVAVAWNVATATVIRASYGEGFKAPTLYQLFSDYGNRSLEPEAAHGWDAGVEQRLLDEAVTLSAVYFNRDTSNMIDFVFCSLPSSSPACTAQPNGYYDNVRKATSTGIELGASAVLSDQLRVTANYTAMEMQNDTPGSINLHRQLPRRPSETLNASLTWSSTFGLATTVAVQKSGRSYDNAANTVVLDAYTLLDLRATYDFSQTLQIYGRVENALDEEYETSRRYGSLGRGAFAGFRASF